MQIDLVAHNLWETGNNPNQTSGWAPGVPHFRPFEIAAAAFRRYGLPWVEPPHPETTAYAEMALYPLDPGRWWYGPRPTERLIVHAIIPDTAPISFRTIIQQARAELILTLTIDGVDARQAALIRLGEATVAEAIRRAQHERLAEKSLAAQDSPSAPIAGPAPLDHQPIIIPRAKLGPSHRQAP